MAPYMPLFRSCTTSRSLAALHAHLIVTAYQKDRLASTKLIESYSQTGSLRCSRLVFDTFPDPDSFMWGVFIKCHVWNGLFQEAIDVYQSMLQDSVELNGFVFPTVLRACSAINELRMGQKVHSRIVKSAFECDPVVQTSLLSMYGEAGLLCSARKVFDEMSVRDVVSWSSIISNYVNNGLESEGLGLFAEMVREGVEVDSVTLLSVAEACSELGLTKIGKSCHGYALRRDMLMHHDALRSSLITMYGKFGDAWTAERLLCTDVDCSGVSWTALLSCYNQNGFYSEVLRVFSEMLACGVESNAVTLMNVVCSCARLQCLGEGKSVHGYAIRNNVDVDKDFLRSSLIDLYASCGDLTYAQCLFDAAQDKHIVSWNILISGYAREDMGEEALSLFCQMLVRGMLPDSFALASALSACGLIGNSELGCQMHCLVIKTSLANEFVQNALIDAYSKCGLVNSAFRVFCDARKDCIVSWNCMMCGFFQNGYPNEALSLFDEMFAECLDMDEVTFLSAIQACSNLGFMNKGKWIHHKLITFGIRNDMYVDTALINMYARCGDLHMAQRVFDNMADRSIVSWSSMMGGYAMHGHADDCISLFNRMVGLGLKPNDVTFMNILSACSHAGYVEKGKLYFNSMIRDFGIVPNSEHYACLVDLLSRGGDLKGAYEVINSMPFQADASIWGALVNGCRIHQRMDFLSSIKSDLANMNADDSGYYTLLSNVYVEGGKWKEFTEVKLKMKSLALKKGRGSSMIEIELHR